MLALAAVTLVVCAPGSPGTSVEAQSAMDALAASLARAAHLPPGSIAAVYDETEAGGLKRLGEKSAGLVDGAQSASLQTLPFANSLAVVGASPPMPVAVIATVSKRIHEERWKELEGAFLRLTEDRSARSALDGVRMAGFVPLDEKALAAARTAYRNAR